MADAEEPVDFEAALGELEQLVAKMETGDLTLEQSLAAFERGVQLTRLCQTSLRKAELRVQALTQEGEVIDLGSGADSEGGAEEAR